MSIHCAFSSTGFHDPQPARDPTRSYCSGCGLIIQSDPVREQINKRPNNARQRKKMMNRIADRDGPGCRYCSQMLFLTIEHLTPKVRGGLNSFENYGLSCWPCNNEKGSMTDEEYITFRAHRSSVDATVDSSHSPNAEEGAD